VASAVQRLLTVNTLGLRSSHCRAIAFSKSVLLLVPKIPGFEILLDFEVVGFGELPGKI
jgi:hypothetical protein